jgi:hypothetical protein
VRSLAVTPGYGYGRRIRIADGCITDYARSHGPRLNKI